MIKDENDINAIFAIIQTEYPFFGKEQGEDSLKMRANLWLDILKNKKKSDVIKSIASFMANDTKGYPPTIGQINQYLSKMTNAPELNEIQAWALVKKALRNSTYNAQTEFDKLPELVKQTIRYPDQLREWSTSEESEVETVMASNFQRSYRAVLQSERTLNTLPNKLRNAYPELEPIIQPLADCLKIETTKKEINNDIDIVAMIAEMKSKISG